MKKVNSFIGKKLLEMLMFSMYPDAKIIYREYVQNAFDSINEAVEEKVLNKVRDGIVTINIDAYNRNISIKDNGKGISVDHALTVLTSIADSQKDGFEQAGVYGIGRLVGAG
jgi:HSP90 family molecular chaperone